MRSHPPTGQYLPHIPSHSGLHVRGSPSPHTDPANPVFTYRAATPHILSHSGIHVHAASPPLSPLTSHSLLPDPYPREPHILVRQHGIKLRQSCLQHILSLLSTVKDCHPKTPCMATKDPDLTSLHPMHIECTSDPQIICHISPCKHSPLGGAHSSDAGEASPTSIPPAWLHGDQHSQITRSFSP
jgi:hypothetical protein